jgi:uncharacterized membrane protein
MADDDTTAAGRFARLADRVRTSLWFWPALAGVVSAAAAEILVRVDRALTVDGRIGELTFGGDADAARTVLSTVAGASMTVLGVTISITLAVLTLAAQGYTPRVLSRFMRDRGVQAVVASLIATFTFSLGALRLVRVDDVPGITVNVAVLAALAALGVLIGFFHHLASEIRVERVIAGAWADALPVIDRLGSLARGPLAEDVVVQPVAAEARARLTGRVVWIDERELMRIADDCGSVIVVVAPVGEFICEGETVARSHGGRPPSDDELGAIADAVQIGTQRTHASDLSYGLRQITDIALRALSPSLNDSTTAHEAILRAADLLRRLADRDLGMRMRDDDGALLMMRDRPDWEDIVGLCVDQLSAEAEAQADAATMLVLLDALNRVAAETTDPGRLAVLRDRARRLRDGARRSLTEPRELERVEAAARTLA